jgi:hypothetical protein
MNAVNGNTQPNLPPVELDATDRLVFQTLAAIPGSTELDMRRLFRWWQTYRLPNEAIASFLVRAELFRPLGHSQVEWLRVLEAGPTYAELLIEGGADKLLDMLNPEGRAARSAAKAQEVMPLSRAGNMEASRRPGDQERQAVSQAFLVELDGGGEAPVDPPSSATLLAPSGNKAPGPALELADAAPGGEPGISGAEGWEWFPAYLFGAEKNLPTHLPCDLPEAPFKSFFLVDDTGHILRLWPGRRYTVGKETTNAIVLDHEGVDARQIALEFVNHAFRLYALNKSGARINEETVWEKTLEDKDLIQVGPVHFHYYEGDFRGKRPIGGGGRQTLMMQKLDSETSISGRISELGVADLLQLFHSSRKTGTLQLMGEGPQEKEGLIQLENGNITYAELQGTGNHGQDAVYELIKLNEGQFLFTRGKLTKSRPNVRSNTMMLLLECARMMDESRTEPK